MPRTRIKICGVMRPEDARLACALGADAIGMIFHPPARRNISLDQARLIIQALGPFATPVGVFVNRSTADILQTAQSLPLRTVQLHGDESPAQAAELSAAGLRVLKALRVDDRFEQSLALWRSCPALAAIVLESPNTTGGAGQPNDWPRVQQAHFGDMKIIAAGGLTPQTVAAVVQSIHPYAVDVSSGVEEQFGQKSEAKLRHFFSEVRRADAGN